MIPYYEQLTDQEKEELQYVIRLLQRQTFLLERKYEKRSGRLVYNKDYRIADYHLEFLKEYFQIAGIELKENSHMGILYIEGETILGEKIPKLATIYLLILKLLYDEHMEESSVSNNIYTSIGEINEKIGEFHLLKNLSSITEMRRAIALLKRYQMIEPLDVLEELNEDTRMIIYPCVNVVLMADDVRKLIESFRKEDERGNHDGEETAVQGVIEDLSE